jgi:ATP-dependent RNA helicase RhlE
VRCLIVSPTRELALQSTEQLEAMSSYVPVRGLAVFGGAPMPPQVSALKQGVDVLSATPGRLMDHMRSGIVDFSRLEVLVLDEADRMMDMGFWPDVRRIVSALPVERQTLLFSATMPPNEVMRFADTLAPDAVFVQVGSRRGPAATISHEAKVLPGREKASFLARYLRRTHEPAIVLREHEDRLRSAGAPAWPVGPARGGHSRGPVAGRANPGAGTLQGRKYPSALWRRTWPRAASTSRMCPT